MTYLLSVVVVFAVLLLLAAIRDYQRRRGLPYPPGPRPLPLLGNYFDIPQQFPWLACSKFSKNYGNILSFQMFGQVIVVLNTTEAAKDLLEKRSAIYSDRPGIPILEKMEWQWSLATSRSNNYWRTGRRMLDRGLRPFATASHGPMIQAKTRVLLSRLLESPQQWEDHIEIFQGELILAMTYGYHQVQGCNDKMIEAIKRRNKFALEEIPLDAFILNYIPLFCHIPTYKRLIRLGRDLGRQVLYPPIRFVKEGILNGTAIPSLALENLQELEDQNLNGSDHSKAEEVIAGVLASTFTAGFDTTVAAMKWFLVAMMIYPDVQKRGQAELDSVIGRERLPTFDGRSRLPFIDAVCKEVLRWHPVAPIGVPHAATKDDIYAGFFIPKGALVIGNTWSILQDPARYSEPDVFKPERFLNPDGSLLHDPVLTSAFGFGKRVCPGKHLVDATLFMFIASLFSSFNIERVGTGGDKLSDYKGAGSLLSSPDPFPCSFIPRDRKARELILADVMSR